MQYYVLEVHPDYAIVALLAHDVPMLVGLATYALKAMVDNAVLAHFVEIEIVGPALLAM